MIAAIDAALAPHGLIARGLVALAGDEWGSARTAVLVGNEGAAYWAHFARWRREQPDGLANPLDTWSRRALSGVAESCGARVLMPNDRPYAPFQQWAMRAQGLRPSPLGLLVHPEYGLWHAYRGALLFDVEISIQAPDIPIHPCDACVGKPCLNACPAGAFSGEVFAYQRCLDHVRGPDGSACRERGCLARNACPVGTHFRYPAKVQAFHQKAFASL